MLDELWNLYPSLFIVYNTNTRKTQVMDKEKVVSTGDHIDSAIYQAWNNIIGKEILKNDRRNTD